MSEHKLDIDIQELAKAIQEIRKQLENIEKIIQQALMKEVEHGPIDSIPCGSVRN